MITKKTYRIPGPTLSNLLIPKKFHRYQPTDAQIPSASAGASAVDFAFIDAMWADPQENSTAPSTVVVAGSNLG